jgi:hypothetical protein
MRSWKEIHYSRGTEFVQLLVQAIGGAKPETAPTPAATASRPEQSTSLPKSAAPTTAAVFKSIPWKK